jgi:hypothetical protein
VRVRSEAQEAEEEADSCHLRGSSARRPCDLEPDLEPELGGCDLELDLEPELELDLEPELGGCDLEPDLEPELDLEPDLGGCDLEPELGGCDLEPDLEPEFGGCDLEPELGGSGARRPCGTPGAGRCVDLPTGLGAWRTSDCRLGS